MTLIPNDINLKRTTPQKLIVEIIRESKTI